MIASLCLAWLSGPAAAPDDRVTFLATSDCHDDAFENEDRSQRGRDTLVEMNAITQRAWPQQLGGGPIEHPRGVLVLGDGIDDGNRLLEGRHQTKTHKMSRTAKGKTHVEWDGSWEWKHPLSRS